MIEVRHLDHAYQLLDNFLADLSNVSLQERIQINDYGTASIHVDDKIADLTVDAKKTIALAKNLYNQIENSKRKAVTGNFLKFFRLISENSKKVALTMSRLLSDTTWFQSVPGKVVKKGVQAIEFFRSSINEVIADLNAKIFIENDRIALIPKLNWKFVKSTEDQRKRQQRLITARNVPLFEAIFMKAKSH